MIQIELSDLDQENEFTGQRVDAAIFHDIRFKDDRAGGNQNVITFEIKNLSGNDIGVSFDGRPTIQCSNVKIEIKGDLERREFLHMLRYILHSEKMGDKLF